MKGKDDTMEHIQLNRDTAKKAIEELKKILEDPDVSPETKVKAAGELPSLAHTLLSGGLK